MQNGKTDGGNPSSSAKQENVSSYSSSEAVERYSRQATAHGLYPAERTVVQRYFSPPRGSVLDVGCGAGRTTAQLANVGFDVIGIDISEPMIQAARETYPDLDFRVADASDLPFEAGRFDYALFSYCGLDYLHPKSDRLECLKEIRRVLTEGGFFAFSSHNSWYNFPALLRDRAYLKRMYLQNGNLSRLFSSYKIAGPEYETVTYITNPRDQKKELTECGFEFVEVVGKRGAPLEYFERLPYYVARKPLTNPPKITPHI